MASSLTPNDSAPSSLPAPSTPVLADKDVMVQLQSQSPVAIANSLILAYFRDRDLDFAHAAFLQQLEDTAQPVYLGSHPLPPLVALVEHWLESSLAQSLASASLTPRGDQKNALGHVEDTSINHPPTDSCLQLQSPLPEDAHASYPFIHASNILTSQALVIPALDPQLSPLLVTSAADRSIQVTDPTTSHTLASVTTLPAPALAIAQHPRGPNVLAAGCMDGSIVLLRATATGHVSITQTLPTHTPRPCVTLVWTPDGSSLVSGGYNRQLTVSAYDPDTCSLLPTPTLHYHFPNPIESLVLSPTSTAPPPWRSSSSSPSYALVAVRDSSVLFLCNITRTQPPTEISTHDANSLPGHVSFSVLHLAASPSGKYVLGATSATSGRLLLWRWKSLVPVEGEGDAAAWGLELVRNFYAGGAQDEWSKPRVAWLASDAYFAVTSDTHALLVMAAYPITAVGTPDQAAAAADVQMVRASGLQQQQRHLYTTTSAQVVGRLRGHTHVVRDVTYSPELKALVSGGFDQVVRVWKVLRQDK